MRDRLETALKFDERIWRAYLLLKPIHKDGLLDELMRVCQPTGTTKQTVLNMQAWLRAIKEPEKLEYRIEYVNFPITRPGQTFKATCLSWQGHATYAPTQLEALNGCIESVRTVAYNKLREVLGWMEDRVASIPDYEPDPYQVPKWRKE